MAQSSARQIVFFFTLNPIESNIGQLFEISNQMKQFLPFSKVTISNYLQSSFNSFVAPYLCFVV